MNIPRWNIGQALGAIVGGLLGLTFSSAVFALLVTIIGWGSLPFLSCLCAGPVIGWLIGRNSPNKGVLVVTGVLAGFVAAFLFSATGIGFLLLFALLFVWVAINVWGAGRSGARIGEKLGWVMPGIHISRWAMILILAIPSGSVLAVCLVATGYWLGPYFLNPQPCTWSDGILKRTGCLQVLRTGKSPISGFSLAPQGDFIAQSDFDGRKIRLWQVRDGKLLSSIAFYSSADVMAFGSAADGPVVAAPYGSGSSRVQMWRVRDGTPLYELQANRCRGPGCKLAFSQRGEMLAAIAYEDGRLWRTGDGTLLHALWGRDHALKGEVQSLAFSPDGKFLAVGDGSGKVTLWRTDDGVLANTLNASDSDHPSDNVAGALAYSPDGRLLASRTNKGNIQLWEVDSGVMMLVLASNSPLKDDLAFSSDGKLLAAVAEDGVVHFWNVADGSQARTYKLPHVPARSHLAFAADGLIVAWYENPQPGKDSTNLWMWLVKD